MSQKTREWLAPSMIVLTLVFIAFSQSTSLKTNWLYHNKEFVCHAFQHNQHYYTAAHCLEGAPENIQIGEQLIPTNRFITKPENDLAYTAPIAKTELPKKPFDVEIEAVWGKQTLRIKTKAHIAQAKDVPGLETILHPETKILVIQTPVRAGFSGSPVLYKNKPVAIISCGDTMFTYAPLINQS